MSGKGLRGKTRKPFLLARVNFARSRLANYGARQKYNQKRSAAVLARAKSSAPSYTDDEAERP